MRIVDCTQRIGSLAVPDICTYNNTAGFEWDADKERGNVRKHGGVRFEESRAVFEVPYAITITDDESDKPEKRFVSIGTGGLGRVLVVVYTYRGATIRIISAQIAARHECTEYEKGML